MNITPKKVKIFRIKNRKGYAALCMNHLTEGSSVLKTYDRMIKALKRSGYKLKEMDSDKLKKLVLK